MSNRQLSEVAKILMISKKRIENEDDWCSEDRVRDPCSPFNNGVYAHRVCALRAIAMPRKNMTVDDMIAIDYLSDAAKELFNYYGCTKAERIVEVNADGHAAVMKMYDRAIYLALKEQTKCPNS